jgi:uncharacterized phage protein (TIGR02220 family)
MIRVEGRQPGRGVIIDARALEDPNLSFRAKGLLSYLQTLPHNQTADVKSLERASLEKGAAIKTALKELADSGYVTSIDEPEGEAHDSDAGVRPVTHGALMDSLFGELAEHVRTVQERPRAETKNADAARRVQRIIDHLNMLRERSWRWAQYTPLSAKYAKNVEHINGRLRDGYTEEDLVLVLDYLAATDGGKEESRRYFNCVTPFNTKNFEGNLALARDWQARGRRTSNRRSPGTRRGKEYYLEAGEENG